MPMLENPMTGRPPAPVLMSAREKKHTLDVLDTGSAVFAVFLRGRPISLRRNCGPEPNDRDYLRSSFCYYGLAARMVTKLNRLFDTDEFYVVRLEAEDAIPVEQRRD